MVPMPTLPLLKTVRSCCPVEEATTNRGRVVAVLVPCTTKVAVGVELPMPTL